MSISSQVVGAGPELLVRLRVDVRLLIAATGLLGLSGSVEPGATGCSKPSRSRWRTTRLSRGKSRQRKVSMSPLASATMAAYQPSSALSCATTKSPMPISAHVRGRLGGEAGGLPPACPAAPPAPLPAGADA